MTSANGASGGEAAPATGRGLAAAGQGLEARLAGVRSLLGERGIDGTVTAAGRENEIAAIACDPERRDDVAELADRIRALGFRYVALELGGMDTHDEDS